MKLCDVLSEINSIKKRGRIYTNFYNNIDKKTNPDLQVRKERDNIVFIEEKPFKKKAYFVGIEESVLSDLFRTLPDGTVMESLYRQRDEFEELFLDSGLKKYTTYMRKTIKYRSNPYAIPEKGKKKLLEELYNSQRGIYAHIDDLDQLYELNYNNFNVLGEEVLTKQEWEEIIKNKQCLVYKEDNDILTFYVWKISGKLFYSYLTYNQGPANYRYDLERRVFEEYWNRGIRIYYSWINLENKIALRRGLLLPKDVGEESNLYNSIYLKEDDKK